MLTPIYVSYHNNDNIQNCVTRVTWCNETSEVDTQHAVHHKIIRMTLNQSITQRVVDKRINHRNEYVINQDETEDDVVEFNVDH